MTLRRDGKDADGERLSPQAGGATLTRRRRQQITMALIGAALIGCSREPEPEVTGDAQPPAEFGTDSVQTKGCPDLEGLYGWPWAQGQPFGYRSPTVRDKFGDVIGMSLHEESQIWVSGPDNSPTRELAIRTRMVNRDPNLSIQSLTHEWSYQLRSSAEYTCEDGWVELPEIDLVGDSVAQWFGGEGVKVSARLSQLDDSSLVLGQRVRVWGRTASALPVPSKLEDRRLPDKVSWYWTRLTRIGPTGKDAPPVDANGPDRRVFIDVPR
jgi:hypothetical protein